MSIGTCRKCGQQLIGECFFCRTERKDPIDDKYNIPPEIEKAREKELQELIANTQDAAPEIDTWECDWCEGKGWIWALAQVGERESDQQDCKTPCEACNELGWLGPDAEKAAKR